MAWKHTSKIIPEKLKLFGGQLCRNLRFNSAMMCYIFYVGTQLLLCSPLKTKKTAKVFQMIIAPRTSHSEKPVFLSSNNFE